MENIGIIASVIAAFAAIATLWVTVRNTKGNILKRIDHKEDLIRRIDDQQIRMYGLHKHPTYITPLDEKKSKLHSEINDLKRKL